MTYTPLPHRTIHDDHNNCFCCGVDRWVGRSLMARQLQEAHLKKLSMGMKKSTDRRGIILLCMTCHMCYDGARSGSTINGRDYPWITWGQAIFLKMQHDPMHYDKSYIEELFAYIPNLGKLEAPPEIFTINARDESRRVG